MWAMAGYLWALPGQIQTLPVSDAWNMTLQVPAMPVTLRFDITKYGPDHTITLISYIHRTGLPHWYLLSLNYPVKVSCPHLGPPAYKFPPCPDSCAAQESPVGSCSPCSPLLRSPACMSPLCTAQGRPRGSSPPSRSTC